jgi:hypothetical protein
MSGNLYQLKTTRPVTVRQCVIIQGPYDTFGYVVKVDPKGTGHHLIRGTGHVREGMHADAPVGTIGGV